MRIQELPFLDSNEGVERSGAVWPPLPWLIQFCFLTAAYLGLIINIQCSVVFPSLFKATRFGHSLLWTAFISSIYLCLSEVIESNLSILKNECIV